MVAAAKLVRQALTEVGLTGAVKTSGAKGVHVYVPIEASADDAAAATRAIAVRAERLDPALATTAFIKDDREGKVFLDSTRAHGATVAAVYSPRARPGVTVSFPVAWDDLDAITPADFTVHSVPALVAGAGGAGGPWAGQLPAPQPLSADLVAEGHEIPIARVQAMHEGKRRARAKRAPSAVLSRVKPGRSLGARNVREAWGSFGLTGAGSSVRLVLARRGAGRGGSRGGRWRAGRRG